jgi:hypothetical protein
MENILPAGRTRRLVNGVVFGVLALAAVIGLLVLAASPLWFALVFLLAWMSALMLLQARDRT